MSRPRRARALSDITEAQWAFLNDALTDDIGTRWERYGLRCDVRLGGQGRSNADLWREYGPAVMARWIEDRPGTRPSLWWRFDAPRHDGPAFPGLLANEVPAATRMRLGGTGTPLHECSAYVAEFAFGVPVRWYEPGHSWRSGEPIDPADPPRFEAQAAYLDRHGLLLPGERARLNEADFAPGAVQVEHG